MPCGTPQKSWAVFCFPRDRTLLSPRDVCGLVKFHGLNRTKTFHVKRFGTIGLTLLPPKPRGHGDGSFCPRARRELTSTHFTSIC